MTGIEERVDDIIAKDGSLSLKSFEIQDDLNRTFWDKRSNNRIFPEIRIALLNIAQDFLKTLSLDEVLDKNKFVDPNHLVKDVLFLGSLASYNYSSYSDVDLHLLLDLSILKLTPDQAALVKSYFNLKKNDWNASHPHLLVKGHDVELYVQDVNEENAANGIYSLTQDRWLKLPVRLPDHSFSEKQVKAKAMWYITRIDHLDEMLNTTPKFSWQIQKIHDICKQIKDKLVMGRRHALNDVSKASRNEMCEPNLVFKVLRRTGHIGKLNDMINKSYDMAKSLAEEETRCGFEVAEDCCCVAALGGDGFGDGAPALTKGDYHLPEVLTKKSPLRRYSKNVQYNENGSMKEMLKNLFPNLPPVPTEKELRAKEETFHVGDKVKVVDNIRCIQKGKVGTISRIDPDDGHGWKLFIVKFDDEQYGSMGFQSDYIDKVSEVSETTKITLTIGQLKRLLSEASRG